MSGQPTRRELLVAGVSAAIAGPTIVSAQSPTPAPADHVFEVPERGKPLLPAALENNRNNSKERATYKLAENSEPCFTYQPEPAQVKSR